MKKWLSFLLSALMIVTMLPMGALATVAATDEAVSSVTQDLSTTEKILAAAFALKDGESLQKAVTLTGKVISVDTPYDASFGNVTVTFTVEGKNLRCYRLKGTGADKVKEDDTITVTGIIKNYMGTIEFDSGCTLDKRVAGTVSQKEYKVVDAPKTGVAYKFGMIQGNVSATNVYYLIGGMNGFYMATGASAATAIDVYLESTDGGYYLYGMVGGKKQYINMVVSGTHVNGQYADKASTVYTYDKDAKTLVAMVQSEGDEAPAAYWFGTRNDKTYTTVGPCKTEYEGFYCMFYAEAGGETPDEPDTPVVPDEPETPEDPVIVVSDVTGTQGETIDVTVSLKNNPGLQSAKVKVLFDNTVLELKAYKAGEFAASGYAWGKVENANANGGFVINWCDAINDPSTAELLATLTFEVKADAVLGTYTLGLEYSCEDDFYTTGFETVYFDSDEGSVKIICDHEYDTVCDTTCNVCGGVREVEPHPYVAEVTVAATCVTDGVMTYTCSVCGDSYTEVIKGSGAHSYSAACDPVCDTCGFDRSDIEAPSYVEVQKPTVVVVGGVGRAGDTITVPVYLKKNPGLQSAKVKVGYDASVLTLTEYKMGDFPANGYSWKYGEPLIVNWCNAVGDPVTVELLATLTFRIWDNAKEGAYPITLEFSCEDDFYTTDFVTVDFEKQESFIYVSSLQDHIYDHDCDATCNVCGDVREVKPHAYVGKVTVAATCVTDGVMTYTCSICGDNYTEAISANGSHTYDNACDAECNACGHVDATRDHTYSDDLDHDCDVCGYARANPGDVNGDGRINNKDLGALQQYLNESNNDFVLAAGDVNGDGRINNKDLGLMQQYLNDWDVELR